MKTLLLSVSIVLSLTTTVAKGSAQNFAEIVEILSSCNESCENQGFSFITYMDSGETMAELPTLVLQNLREVANHQADVWGDTVYEGEVIPNGDVEIYSVEGVFLFGKHQLYRITYGQSAWGTGNCEINWEEEDPSFEECEPGTVSETSLVSSDFKEYEVDRDSYAQFESDF